MSRKPHTRKPRPQTGRSPETNRKYIRLRRALDVRAKLVPKMTLTEVGRILGLRKQTVQYIELTALRKIISAFEAERLDKAFI